MEQDLLSKRGATYSDRPRLVVANELALKGMHILLRPYDDGYKCKFLLFPFDTLQANLLQIVHHKMQAPLLTSRSSNLYRPLQDLESKQLLYDLLATSSNEKGIDAHEPLERATASAIYALIYGFRLLTGKEWELKRAHDVQAEFSQLVRVGAYIVDTFPILNDLPLPTFLSPWKKDAASHFEAQKSLHMENLERGIQSPGYNFSKEMRQSVESIGMPDVELAFDLGIVADAALDTTTSTMDWFLVAWISEGHRFVSKAQAYIDKVVGRERLPSYEDRTGLVYIDAIVEEIMRWRPIGAGGVPHYIKSEDSYEGYRIPAGSIVLANHWAVSRDPIFGAQVDAFVPERWLGNDGELKELPVVGFGYGRRACTGRYIARNSLFLQIARMLWAFDVEPGLGVTVDPMAATDGLVSGPLPFRARFRPRGPWVNDIVGRDCDMRDIDIVNVLDKIGAERMSKS